MEKTIACHSMSAFVLLSLIICSLSVSEPYWSNLHQTMHLINMSHLEAERCDETVAALASLSMGGSRGVPTNNRLVLLNIQLVLLNILKYL